MKPDLVIFVNFPQKDAAPLISTLKEEKIDFGFWPAVLEELVGRDFLKTKTLTFWGHSGVKKLNNQDVTTFGAKEELERSGFTPQEFAKELKGQEKKMLKFKNLEQIQFAGCNVGFGTAANPSWIDQFTIARTQNGFLQDRGLSIVGPKYTSNNQAHQSVIMECHFFRTGFSAEEKCGPVSLIAFSKKQNYESVALIKASKELERLNNPHSHDDYVEKLEAIIYDLRKTAKALNGSELLETKALRLEKITEKYKEQKTEPEKKTSKAEEQNKEDTTSLKRSADEPAKKSSSSKRAKTKDDSAKQYHRHTKYLI